jgi:uncharacterized phage-associated protein
VKLTPNRRKILEAIIFLIQEGRAQEIALTQYQIVKSLFMADTSHLNAFGRPVTFDNYSALEFGPVPEEAYDMLKPTYPWWRVGADAAPWTREQFRGNAYRFTNTRDANLRALSETDQKALREGLRYVLDAGFGGVVDRTHQHPAYKEAWEHRGNANAKAMDYALLFEEPDPAGAKELAYASAHA